MVDSYPCCVRDRLALRLLSFLSLMPFATRGAVLRLKRYSVAHLDAYVPLSTGYASPRSATKAAHWNPAPPPRANVCFPTVTLRGREVANSAAGSSGSAAVPSSAQMLHEITAAVDPSQIYCYVAKQGQDTFG